MKKLYEIKLSSVAYALGETLEEAKEIFLNEVSCADLDLSDHIESVVKADKVHPDWLNCFPYGDEGNKRTCKDWMEP